jgi:site-specific DNA-cytosine methylase
MGFTPEHIPGGGQWLIPVSDTQAYRQFGNSIVVPMVQAVARSMVQQFNLLGPALNVSRKAG